jgi:hypothetical protein
MKKQIFTIILLWVGCITAFGQSLKIDATGTNDMRLRTNNIDRLNILTNGNVGIGLPAPLTKFHVQSSSTGVTPAPNNVAIFESNANTYLSILHGVGNEGAIIFANALGGIGAGYIGYEGATDLMKFGTGSSTKMSISSFGNVGIGAVPSLTHKLYVNGSQFINSDLKINSLIGTGTRPVQVDATGLLLAGTNPPTTNTYNPFISVSAASARKIGVVTDSDFQYMIPACLAGFVSGIKYGDGQIVMPVEFPDGAILTSMHLSAIDNSSGHILEAKLMRVPKTGTASTQAAICSVSTSGLAMSASVQEASFTITTLTTIDNGSYFYYILVDITSISPSWPGGALLALRGVRFKYQITY